MNYGMLLKEINRKVEAIDFFNKSVKLKENYSTAYLNLGVVYEELKDRKNAIHNYEMAIKSNPYLYEIWPSLLHSELHLFKWDNIVKGTNIIKTVLESNYKGEILPFNLLSLNNIFERDQYNCARIYSEVKFSKNDASKIFKHENYTKNKGEKPIKLGFLSADIRNHAVLFSISELIIKLDRKKFSVYVFSYGPNDQSSARNDFINCLRPGEFHDIEQLGYYEAAAYINDLKIELLIDLTGYTSHCRPEILAYKPAPKQISYLGYPTTMGDFNTIQFLIADHITIPEESEKYYSEKIIRMNSCYFPIDSRLTLKKVERTDENLPKDKFIFCCFNQPYKINQVVVEAWVKILKRCGSAILWLHSYEPDTRNNILNIFQRYGIKKERIYFANGKKEMIDHLSRISVANVGLDTFPYNGHTTSSDTMRSGVPVVTIKGNTFASRVTNSMNFHNSLDELNCDGIDSYIKLAVKLCNNNGYYQKIKGILNTINAINEFQNADKIRFEFERALLEIYSHEYNSTSGK